MTNEPRPNLPAADPASRLATANLEALVPASARLGLRGYRAAPPADDCAWVKRARACAGYAVALLRAAAKPVSILTCRVGEIRLDLSTGKDELEGAPWSPDEAEAAHGRSEPFFAAGTEAVAAAPTLLDILGPPLRPQRRDPRPMRCPFDFDVQDPGMDDPHVRRG